MLDLIHHYLYFSLFLVGFCAATVDAIAGGGGLISLPMLLGLGLPPHLALGTNKLQSSFGTFMAAFSYYRRGFLEQGSLRFGFICTFIGAVTGAVAIQFLHSDILKQFIPFVLLFVLIYMLFSPRLGLKDQPAKMSEKFFLLIFGTLLGFYDGFLGPGVGSFWVFLLMYFLGKNLVKATAFTKAFNANTNITALICFALGHNIDYKIGAYMIVGQLIGGRLGAHLAMKKGARLIRPLFITVMGATIITLIYRNYATMPLSAFFKQADKTTVISTILSAVVLMTFLLIKKIKKQRE